MATKEEVIEEIMATAQKIEDLPLADSTEGLTSLAAMTEGGDMKRVPLTMLKGADGQKGEDGHFATLTDEEKAEIMRPAVEAAAECRELIGEVASVLDEVNNETI